jgi:hypothetical protein
MSVAIVFDRLKAVRIVPSGVLPPETVRVVFELQIKGDDGTGHPVKPIEGGLKQGETLTLEWADSRRVPFTREVGLWLRQEQDSTAVMIDMGREVVKAAEINLGPRVLHFRDVNNWGHFELGYRVIPADVEI